MKESAISVVAVGFEPEHIMHIANKAHNANLAFHVCAETEAAVALLSSQPFSALIIKFTSTSKEKRDFLRLVRFAAHNFPKTKILAINAQDDPLSVMDNLSKEFHPSDSENSELPIVKFYERLSDFLPRISIDAYLQPIVPLSGHLTAMFLGVESLARTNALHKHWSTEFLFAYAALREQLLELEIVCIRAALKAYHEAGRQGKLFINLRPRSLTESRCIDLILAALKAFRVSPRRVVFEFTEQQSILNFDGFLQAASELRELGFGIAVDDYGVGFANLQLVQELRPDYLKISGVFSQNLHQDNAKQVIVESITSMSQRLGIATILENIETQEDLEKAAVLRVTFGQGYHICRPCPPKQFKAANWQSC